MATKLHDKINSLSKGRKKKVRQRANDLIAKEMTLQDLRKALSLTQKHLAEKLHLRQDGISRIEKRSDLLLSTLQGYVSAMGGELKLTVEFPSRAPVLLQGFRDGSNTP